MGKAIFIVGFSLIITNLFIYKDCSRNPYKWNKFDNILFYALTRFSWAFAWMLLAFYIILGHASYLTALLCNNIFNSLGRIVFIMYLITPIVMMVVYSSTVSGVFMTIIYDIYMVFGHFILAIIFGILIYIFIQYPLNKII
jgi:hypothetical protein